MTTTNLHLAPTPCRQASNGVMFHSFMNDELICQCGKTDAWGKLLPPPTKTAIVIELDRLRDLMQEFAVEQEPDADSSRNRTRTRGWGWIGRLSYFCNG